MLAGLEGRPGKRTGHLGKAACAAGTPDGSLPPQRKKAGENALAKGRLAKVPDPEGSAASAISSCAWHQPGVSSSTLPWSSFTARTSLPLSGTEKAEIALEG